MAQVDNIVVGQGLTGSILSYQLLEAGESVKIIDSESGATASRKAAGLINPITGKRFVKSWMIDEVLPTAVQTYQTLEKKLGVSLIKQIKAYRVIHNTEQLNDAAAKLQNDAYQSYLQHKIHPLLPEQIINPLGCIAIEKVHQIAVGNMLDSFRDFFQKADILLKETFDSSKLFLGENSVSYEEITAKRILFCEGYQLNKNPFFNYLPLRPVKGEALIIAAPQLELNAMLNGKCSISPRGKDAFYVGYTYDWKDRDRSPTEEKKNYLSQQLEAVLKVPYKILDQMAGIRPASLDRRPFIGRHPKHHQVYVFNGMGTKGLSLAPYFGLQLIDHILHKKPLIMEADIRRFAKYYEG